MTTIPTFYNSFNYAQTFYMDPSLVKDASEVGITRIDLYFRGKPPEKNNKSGILAPGCEVTLVPVVNGVPAIDYAGAVRPTEPTEHGAKFAFYSTGAIARREWGEIQASTDASVPTTFKFSQPFFVKTNAEYGILVKFDGNEDFILWSTKKGDPLVGTTTASPGVSGQFIGNLFQFVPQVSNLLSTLPTGLNSNNAATINTTQNAVVDPNVNSKYTQSNWKPFPDTDLKFKVYVARYAQAGGVVATNNTLTSNPTISGSTSINPNNNLITVASDGVITMAAQVNAMEYIVFDRRVSKTRGLNYGDAVYQQAPNYPGNRIVAGVLTPLSISVVQGSDTVTANGNYVLANGVTFAASGGFKNIFTVNGTDIEYIVVVSGSEVNVRQISSVDSNTSIKVNGNFDFSNSTAYFFKSAVGYIGGVAKSYVFGRDDDLLTLYNSNANGTVRFVNNTIESVNILTAGGGYSNTDYMVIGNTSGAYGARGFEYVPTQLEGGYEARANLVTDSTGGVIAVYVSNAGAGFTNVSWIAGSNVKIVNSSGAVVPTATANGATFSYTVGSTLKTEFTQGNSYFGNTRVINIEAHRVKPEITVNNPLGTSFAIRHRTLFYSKPSTNTSTGKAYYIANTTQQAASDLYVKIFKSHTTPGTFVSTPVVTSRSNEFIIRYANGAPSNTDIIGKGLKSNTAVFMFDVSSNSDFSAPFFDPDIVNSHYAKYVINNDYTGEEGNYGNAYAKHITSKVNFNNNRFAEDILVYLTAYRPSNTDIKVYARLHNSNDPEAFDDKDWSLLQIIDGASIFSSRDNSSDFIELTYNLPQFPNTATSLIGTVAVAQGNDIVTGSGTNFNTSLISDDLIKIYNPLFPTNYVVAVVNNVISDTQFKVKRGFGDLSANLAGTVAVTSGSATITGTGTQFTSSFSNGDFVGLWSSSSLYEIYKINVVSSATVMNVDSTVSFTNASTTVARLEANTFTNSSISGTGLRIDRLAYKHQAFNNQINDNVCRYYNSSMVEYDGYDSFQLKIVMLSDNDIIVPKIDDVRAVGVSA